MEPGEVERFSVVVRDHATNPRNHGLPRACSGHGRITGPCGDTMEFWIEVQAGNVARIAFITDGCGSSLACGSMATCLAQDQSVETAAALKQVDILRALGGLPPEFEHCALLAANTLRAACEDHLRRRGSSAGLPVSADRTCSTCDDGNCSMATRGKHTRGRLRFVPFQGVIDRDREEDHPDSSG